MKTQKYIVTIEMPDGDYIGASILQDDIQGFCDVEEEGRDKVSVEEVSTSEDLEAKAAQYESYFDVGEQHGYLCVNKGEMAEAFIAGAEWQKEQMLKDAVEGEVIEDLHGQRYVKSEAVDGTKFKFGDKVKILIIPEKEE